MTLDFSPIYLSRLLSGPQFLSPQSHTLLSLPPLLSPKTVPSLTWPPPPTQKLLAWGLALREPLPLVLHSVDKWF